MSLDWNKFYTLPGAPDRNFELLCRGIIRQNYGSYGKFISYSNMAGIEFYLSLEDRCTLGEPERVFGWQCKWYQIDAGRSIGTTRKSSVEDGIRKTEKYFPQVTDWVLWTKNTLTSADQEWFNSIKTLLTLHLNDSEDIESATYGPAEILVKSYFGELALNDVSMDNLTRYSIAPIKRRWNPELHQETKIDREVMRFLGCGNSWSSLKNLAYELESLSESLLKILDNYECSDVYLSDTASLIYKSIDLSNHLYNCYQNLEDGIDDWIDFIEHEKDLSKDEMILSRTYRKKNDINGLLVTNLKSFYMRGKNALSELRKSLLENSLVLSAEAGNGKTEFCAQICSGEISSTKGIIIHGKRLASSSTLFDLIKDYSLNGKSIESFEALLCALNSFGERKKEKILVTFDGLNESEDPRHWKDLVPEIQVLLEKYPRIFCLFTIRPEFIKDSIPDDINMLESKGFEEDLDDAIHRYFTYYKIDGVSNSVPRSMLRHPLSLKLFCEITNPTREQWVRIDSGPQSLYSLMENFVESSAQRISELSNVNNRIFSGDVLSSLDSLGDHLWTSSERGKEQGEYRKLIGDDSTNWNFSILNALESEGVLIRNKVGSKYTVSPVYDVLAGFLIANSILKRNSSESIEDWINDSSNYSKLFGNYSEKSTFSGDIFEALVAMMPKKFYGKNFWSLLEGDEKKQAIIKSAFLDQRYLDSLTVDALKETLIEGDGGKQLWLHLFNLRNIENHPLNIEFTNAALTQMDVATRDGTWSEWVREQKKGFIFVLKNFCNGPWQKGEATQSMLDNFKFFKWCLTLSDREVRDVASKALFVFSLKYPGTLFDETISSLSINDDYIPMRLMGVSFGIVTSIDLDSETNQKLVADFYDRLTDKLLGESATSPTHNMLIRSNYLGITQYLVSNSLLEVDLSNVTFGACHEPDPVEKSTEGIDDYSNAIRMDFENYTLGSLFRDRRNYDNTHEGHISCVSYIRGLLNSFGWNCSKMIEIDNRIYQYKSRNEKSVAERYGKKYSWIGFYRYAGILDSLGQLFKGSNSFVRDDVDPSFVMKPIVNDIDFNIVNFTTPSNDEDWIVKSRVSVPAKIYKRGKIENKVGPWILLNGYLSFRDVDTNRKIFGFVKSFLVEKEREQELIKIFNENDPFKILSNEIPKTYETFACEIPWETSFQESVSEYNDHLFKKISGIDTECISFEYSYEKQNDWLNTASNYYFPSPNVLRELNLKRRPGSLDFYNSNKELVSKTLKVSEDNYGDIFYMRKNELSEYANNKSLITFCWGERELDLRHYECEEWEIELRGEGKNIWKQAIVHKL